MPEPTRVVPVEGIRAVKNESGGALVEGLIVKITSEGDPNVVNIATAGTDTLFGVLEQDVADDGIGDCQVRGKAIVTSGAAVTIGAQITADAAGKGIVTVAAGDSVLGVAVTSTSGADLDFEVELIGPGGGNI